ncbi:DUF4440 domain-containing protein [Rahnella sp. C60]|uniref:nuclear transport factor 2 family protein n=1 Tax=Rahnella perminowiae TaxID=2816244 RepID=UPI001C26E7C6|nr:DUF4440 domain-containing protein [Rahnella perminowiae]MBU9808918.1 DUF4440 domain-containing protein [Rahnella perminowiae]MBU9816924.1 DUF4440 domain-containing protein [Rahnella perminowiae]
MTVVLDEIKALECSLHGVRRKDKLWLEKVLHPDFREITRSGVMVDRQQTVAALTAETQDLRLEAEGFQLQTLNESCVILTYKTFLNRGNENRRYTLRASCWTNARGTGWQIIFHQGTPAAETLTCG